MLLGWSIKAIWWEGNPVNELMVLTTLVSPIKAIWWEGNSGFVCFALDKSGDCPYNSV